MRRTVCPQCGIELTTRYLPKHLRKCSGKRYGCRYCGEICEDTARLAGHTTNCEKNPNRSGMREKQRINSTGRKHSPEVRAKISVAARNSNHRRLRKNSIEYGGVMMDSTWEVRLAQRLDFLGVTWTRPEPLEWIDSSNRKRHYFPDFYLPEFDLYLDPKNRYAYRVQQQKINQLIELLPNLIFLRDIDEIDSFIPVAITKPSAIEKR